MEWESYALPRLSWLFFAARTMGNFSPTQLANLHLDPPRFRRIESISPRNHVHAFRLTSPEEIDAELTAWIAEAYQVGEQRHLRSSMEEPLS